MRPECLSPIATSIEPGIQAFLLSLPGATGSVQNNLLYGAPSGDAFSIVDGNTLTLQSNFCDLPDGGCTWAGNPGAGTRQIAGSSGS
jgi:hypothetical protein